MARFLLKSGMILAALIALVPLANAGGHGHRGGGFSFGFGGFFPAAPYYPAYPYYSPYYYPVYPPYSYAPTVYAAPPVYVAPPPQGPAPPQSWYYCDNPMGYYPNVPNCNTAWRQVAPTPPSGNTITPKAKP